MCKSNFTLMFLALTLACFCRVSAEDIRFPANSGVLNIKAAPYNAVGDGVADDTAAFQAALTASANGNTIHIPNGTYRITDTLSWPGNGGANITLQGQSQAGTILRLPDSTAGFTNASSPKVLLDGKGNHIPERFANSIRNLTVDTGIGNAGVIAVQYYANNMGACRDVTIKGQGLIGLEMSHTRANGPCYVVNTTVDGFQIGIRTGYAMESLVFENITLRNQSTVGWLNENVQRVANGNTHLAASQTLSIRKLHASSLAVTAFKNPSGHVVMLDSTFAAIGGASSLHAIENGAPGQLLLRNISSTGYGRVLRDAASDVPGTSHGEWLSNPVVSQFPASPSTLNLPIQDAPTIPDEDPSTWANIKSFGATNWNASEGTRFDNDAPAIQAAIDSGATTIFIPAGSFRVLSQINVRGNVRRIVGVGGVSTVGAGNNGSGVPYQGIVWCIKDGTSPTVVIENMSCGHAVNMTGVDNQSARTLVLRDLVIQPPKFTGSGDIFIENIVTSYMEFNGQRAWARQLNVERDGDHIINRGGTLWILGLKTEDYGYILDASAGAKTEILGGMIYSLDDTTGTPMIRNSESSLSFSLAEYLGLYGKPYNTLVEETAQGVTRSLARLIPNTSTVAHPAHWSQNKDGTTTGNSGVVGSGFLLYNSAATTSSLIFQGNAAGIPDNAAAPSLTNFTRFAGAQVGGVSVTRTFTVNNAGTDTLNFTANPRIAITGAQAADFAVIADLPASLAPGAQATFQIRFTPSATGTRNATLNIANNITADGAQSFAIDGTGNAPAPDIVFNAAGVSASVPANTTGTATFTVQNTGLGPLTVTPVVPTTYTFCASDQLGGPAYDWIEITEGDNLGTHITALEGQDDRRSITYDIGFDFPFYGTAFSKVYVHSNGYVELTNTASSSTSSSAYTNNSLPTSGIASNTLMPYWDDLYFVNSGTEASLYSKAYIKPLDAETCIVTFKNISFFTTSLRTQRMTFQVVLKRSGEIRYNYQFLDNDVSCTVGLQKDTGTALQALHNTSGTRLKNSFTLRFAPPPVVGGNTWLTALTPSPLVVPASASANFTLSFNSTGLSVGQPYFTHVRLNSDDPDETPAYLPVTLTLTNLPGITPGQSATITAGNSLNYSLQASGSPTSWALVSGSLPVGITLSPATGLLSGSTIQLGSFSPVFTATNALGTSPPVGVTLTVISPLPLIALGQSLTQNFNNALSYSLQATNSPTSWSLISGSLPSGVTLNTATGLLSGVPTTLGTFTPGFTATNSHGTSSGVTVTLLVRPLAYDFNSTQANFNATFLETTSSGSPAWASAGLIATGGINNTGYLATSPDAQSALIDAAFPWAAGRSYTLSVYFKARVTTGFVAAGGGLRLGFADDNLGTLQGAEYVAAGINSVGDQSQLVLVSRQSGTVTATGPNLGTLTDNNWYQLTATFTKSATANRFDVFISLKNWGADGLAGGTVLGTSSPLTATGLTNLYASPGVYAGFRGNSNSSGNGVRGFDDFSITEPVTIPVINASQSTSGTVGLVFNYQLAAANSPTSYALASGSLPGGITLNSSTGLLSGTPTVVGTFAPTFTATNTAGTSPAVSVSINLIAAPSGLTTFRTTHGLAPDGSQDLETPAGDGVQNLLKYAFNMLGSGTGQAASLATPNASVLTANGSAGLPLVGIESSTGKLQLTFIRRKASASPAPGITYAVEFSDAFDTWAVNDAATATVTDLDTTFERVTVTDSTQDPTPSKRFVRIRITSL